MKSYVTYIQGVYASILKDVLAYFPSDHVDVERDLARLTSTIKQRGLAFYTLDLPAIGKQFDRCLATGRLDLKGYPVSRAFRKGSSVPRLFKGLMLRVFDSSGLLKTNPDITALSLLRQLYLAAKKIELPCDTSLTFEAVNEFVKVDSELFYPTASWQEDTLTHKDTHLLDALVGKDDLFHPSHETTIDPLLISTVQMVADVVSGSMGSFDPAWWNPRHGPGVVSDQARFEDKYLFPTWSGKLNNVFPMDTFAFANLSYWASIVGDDGYRYLNDVEIPSRLICVPKTQKGPRLIACESVSQQWCQQIIRDFLVTVLAYTPISSVIHFNDQTKNQEAARLASLNDDAWTIDLSSASDRLSCWTVERMFRKNQTLLTALHAARTRLCENTIDKKNPRFISLRKFSCMGSAVTFPIQTYVFSICAIGALLYSRGVTRITNRTIRENCFGVQVFGDDIIIPKEGGNALLDILRYLQLKINDDKTFTQGNFRESCGFDAFLGHFVSPVSVKHVPKVSRPESVIGSVQCSNRFYERYYQYTSTYIKLTAQKVAALRLPSVMPGSGSFGWYDWCGFGIEGLKKRFNSTTQQQEVSVTIPLGKVKVRPSIEHSALFQYFTERPSPDESWSSGVRQKPTLYLKRRWEPIRNYL